MIHEVRVGRAGRATLLLALLAMLQPVPVLADAGFRKTGGMAFARFSHAAVVLPDGGVMVVSGNTAERYDPLASTFSILGTLTVNRGRGLTATVLLDGRVLIVGGFVVNNPPHASAEIYDPVAGTFAPTGSMASARAFHTATLLADGRVLVAGGDFNEVNPALSTAEIYDPSTGTFHQLASTMIARRDHTATLLLDGRVLISGGYAADNTGLADVEIFDPVSGSFAATGSLAERRGNHTATRLPNGNVLVAGGHLDTPADSLSSAEIYDVVNGSFAPTGRMTIARGSHVAAPLPDGTVLIAGGYTAYPREGITLSSAEIFDPVSGTFVNTRSMPLARGRFIAATLPVGDVLVAGGLDDRALATAEIFSTSLVDNQPPVVSVPSDFSVLATSPDGALVFYSASAVDDIDGNPQLVCEPPPGNVFPIGTTTVLCTATDSFSNTATATFRVTVFESVAIAMTISGSGTVDPISGMVTLSGTVACSRPTQFFNISGQLTQVIANRATLNGEFLTELQCAPGHPVAWNTTVAASNGQFKPGKASTSATAFACDDLGSCAFSNAATTIQLRATR